MRGHEALRLVHELLRPRTYLETGVRKGGSLTLSRTRSIGVDPAFVVSTELCCDVELVRATSDDFFARPDPLAHFNGVALDLALIDGMHLSEFALRDFMNIEKFMAPTGVVVFDDMLPRNHREASRDRLTTAWTGDVYKVILILAEQRPDLTIIPLNTSPTGTVVVLGLDPSSTVLADRYLENLKRCETPDPQVVPQEILQRTTAVDPITFLTNGIWAELVELRDADASRADVGSMIREHLGANHP